MMMVRVTMYERAAAGERAAWQAWMTSDAMWRLDVPAGWRLDWS